MSHSSSSHAAHTITETGHTASLSRQPTQDSEEDPSEHEASSERSTSIHSPTLTPTSVPSPSIRQGPPFRQTARMRVISPTMVNFGSRPQETPAREVSPHPSLISTYHIGGPSSTDLNVTARVGDRMQYLCIEVQDCRIGVEHQETLLFEMFDIVRRLTHQITMAIYTTKGEIVIGRRAWYLGLSVVILVLALEFYGNEGAVGLLSWIEGMESKLHISKCSENSKVEYTTCLLQGRALTWWNTQVQTYGREVALRLTWEEFKKFLLEEYCPKSEVQKLESEFWNHTMVSSDIDKYTTRFHELAKLRPHMVTPEDKRIDRYIWGLALEIRGMVTSANPCTIQSVVVLENRLTNDVTRSRVWKKDNVGNKRMEENQSRNQGGGNLDKRQRNTCPKLNKVLGQGRNRPNLALAIEGNTDRRNNDNQTHGRAFIIGANEAAARFNKKQLDAISACKKALCKRIQSNRGNEKRYSSFKIHELGKKEADTKSLITVDTLENWKEHESGDDEGFAPKEYGMVAGCMCCLVKEGYKEKIRVLSIELENTTNLLKHSERINVEAEIAKKDLQTKLDNHLAKTEKWTSLLKTWENELGWDDSTFSVCTTNSEEVEGRPLFSSYLHLIKDCNYYETQYANDFDSVGYPQREPIWDNATRVTQSNQFVPQVVRLRSGKVSIPDARPNKVPAGRPKPVSTGKHPVHAGRRNSSSVTSGWWQSTARPMTHLPTPTSSYFQTSTPFRPHVYYNQMHYDGDGWATTVKPSAGCSWKSYRNKVYRVNLHTDAGDEGIVDSGCSRSMTGNKERLDDFQPI
ncbi:ribonuclease H-like domain-containing protein [Tanacetum coccineum]